VVRAPDPTLLSHAGIWQVEVGVRAGHPPWLAPYCSCRRRGLADTFCGGKADVTDPNAPLYCPYVWTVEKGDIRTYSGA
jgi:hypothetical protein